MKKLFLSLILMVLPLVVSAYDCQVDGIYYNLIPKGNVAEVTSGGTGYSGSITIPEKFTYEGMEYSVTSIGDYAFRYCSGLTSVTIPNSVTSIGGLAFHGCSGLTSVHITDLAAWCKISFVDNPLYYAHHLYLNGEEIKDLVIPNSVTSIGGSAFYNCSSLTSVTIPSSVTSIGGSAFYNCSGLTSVTIPSSVTSIGGSAFYNCSGLTSVTIPSSVTSIGGSAFSGCTNIEKVFSGIKMIFNINKNVFSDKTYLNAMLYVSSGRIEAYKAATGWQNFVYIEEGEPESIVIPGAPKCATPTISYSNKELSFSCATEGVGYKYTITDSDVKTDYASKVSLSATYEISVYAMKEGLGNSDVATATLVWTDAIFTETTPESPTSAKAIAESIPVLISANGGVVTVKSEQDGQPVAVYSADGKMLGAATVKDGQATIPVNQQRGEIVIVKVGTRSVKVKM